MRVQALTTGGGMDRRRFKGSPDADKLWELTNAFRNEEGTIERRPTTEQVIVLPPDTKGLCAYNDRLLVFSHVGAATGNPLFDVVVLINPNAPSSKIKLIHFAAPFLGFPYVSAEFENGDVWHYWLQEAKTWSAASQVCVGDVVLPTDGNETGYAYRAERVDPPYPPWAPNVARTVGEIVEPTTPGCWKHTVKEVYGDNPRSGATEPNPWATTDGGITIEEADSLGSGLTGGGSDGGPLPKPDTGTGTLPPDIIDRYNPPGGGGEGPPTSEF